MTVCVSASSFSLCFSVVFNFCFEVCDLLGPIFEDDVARGSECSARPVDRLRDSEEQGLTQDRSWERWWGVFALWQRVRNSSATVVRGGWT